MGLYQRMTAIDASKIHVHRFGAALRQWSAGELTRAEVIAMFDLTGDDVTQLDALAATYTGMAQNNIGNALTKANWTHRMEDVFILCEEGDYTEAKAKTALGF